MTDPKERRDFLKAEARSLREPYEEGCESCLDCAGGIHAICNSPADFICDCECHMTKAESRQIEAELREDD